MGGIIAAVVLIVVAIGFSAWWKGRLIGQGKIIQRAKDFVEYAEIFTTRPIANEEYVAALKALDLKKTGVSLEGNTKAVKFSGIYFSEEIEKIYEAYQLPPEVRILLESCIQEIISTERAKYDAELDGLKGEKAKLENKRKKLLEAHYCDAIPLDLLKSEQQKIAKELSSIHTSTQVLLAKSSSRKLSSN